MSWKGILLSLVVGAVVLMPSALSAADVDDVTARFNAAVKAYNARDLDGFLAGSHDRIVAFGPNAPFPTDGKKAARRISANAFANTDSATFTPINPQFRVIGATGIAWGHYAFAVKGKGGPMETTFGRYMVTYGKSGGKWLAVAQHLSPLPSGD